MAEAPASGLKRRPQIRIPQTTQSLSSSIEPAQAEGVMEKITASGLKDAIRSGYDVRLIIDLARVGSELPVDRLGLYAEVISKGWPKASEETRQEQQRRLAAAAWRMVSERKPCLVEIRDGREAAQL
jgi:hypothetical protein